MTQGVQNGRRGPDAQGAPEWPRMIQNSAELLGSGQAQNYPELPEIAGITLRAQNSALGSDGPLGPHRPRRGDSEWPRGPKSFRWPKMALEVKNGSRCPDGHGGSEWLSGP